MKITGSLLLTLLISLSVNASNFEEHQIPVGEGVAQPSSTLNLLNSNNPVGLSSVAGHQLGISHFQDPDAPKLTINAFDYTYGGSTWGVGLDYSTTDVAGATSANSYRGFGVGFDLGSFGLGFSSRSNANSDTADTLNVTNIGLMLNPTGMHRLGAIIYNWANSTSSSNNEKIAIGYAYIDTNYSLVLDYISYSSEKQIITPAFSYFTPDFQFSLSQRMWQGTPGSTDNDVTKIAIGLPFSSFHLGLYTNIVSQTGLSLKMVF